MDYLARFNNALIYEGEMDTEKISNWIVETQYCPSGYFSK
jgi:hypothetical protein